MERKDVAGSVVYERRFDLSELIGPKSLMRLFLAKKNLTVKG